MWWWMMGIGLEAAGRCRDKVRGGFQSGGGSITQY